MATINFEGKTYKLCNDAVMDNYGTTGVAWYASAEDDFGNLYRVVYLPTSAYSAACKIAPLEEMIGNPELRQRSLEARNDSELAEAIADIMAEFGLDDDEQLPDPADESMACDWDAPHNVYLTELAEDR